MPPGGGTAVEGKAVYERACLRCHGRSAAGGNHDPLVGGVGTLTSEKPLRTVTSYWPYATSLWDYVNRSMPFDLPGTLPADDVYAVVAYILSLGKLMGEEDLLDRERLSAVVMPNRDGFVADPRPDTGQTASADGSVAASE